MPGFSRISQSACFLVIAWALWLAAVGLGEQVPANDGLGWDGVRFARYATEGPKALLNREINRYYVQRVGPSLIVHGAIRSFGLPFDAVTIRWAFLGMNLILLSAAIFMLVDVGRHLNLSKNALWLLFIGLFVNPSNGRLPVYYANIGDSMAFTLGMIMVWGWVSRRPWVLALAALVALVSWPAALYLLWPLMVWPRPMDREPSPDRLSSYSPLSWRWVGAALPAGVLLMTASWVVAAMPEVARWTPWTTMSLAVNAWFLGMASVSTLAQMRPVVLKELTQGWSTSGVAVAIALALLGRAYVAATESGSLAFSEGTYWREVLLYVRTRPFAPPVGHFAYFGAGAVLALAMWPRVLSAARHLGHGPFVALALIGLQALDTESRRLNANWPLSFLCAAMAFSPWLEDRRVMAVATALSLLFSKLWWRWSGPNLFAEAHEPGNYYNLQGPSLSDQAFAFHLAAASLLAISVWLVVQRAPARLTSETPGPPAAAS